MENETCQICARTITNPICASCYMKHARLWLRDFGISEKQADLVLDMIMKKLPHESLNEHECVICKNGKLSICMYCAFLKTSRIILNMRIDKKHKEAFIDSLNFSREEDNIE